jgi:hypothetical protein
VVIDEHGELTTRPEVDAAKVGEVQNNNDLSGSTTVSTGKFKSKSTQMVPAIVPPDSIISLFHVLESYGLSMRSGTPIARENQQARGDKVFIKNCETSNQKLYGESLVAGLPVEMPGRGVSECDYSDEHDLVSKQISVTSLWNPKPYVGSDSQVIASNKMEEDDTIEKS